MGQGMEMRSVSSQSPTFPGQLSNFRTAEPSEPMHATVMRVYESEQARLQLNLCRNLRWPRKPNVSNHGGKGRVLYPYPYQPYIYSYTIT